jgi:hypothetical protein
VLTGATDAFGTLVPEPPPCVLRRELVPVLAVRLTSVLSRCSKAAEDVLSLSDGLEMGRVHTRAVAAKMVDLESIWDRSDEVLIRESVHLDDTLVDLEEPIAATVTLASPRPAVACLVDAREKPLKRLLDHEPGSR